MKKYVLFLFLLFFFPHTVFAATPPYQATFSISHDILNDTDVSVDYEIMYEGVFERIVADDRIPATVTIDMEVYTATYVDGSSVEYQVNPEFENEALDVVSFYTHIIGQLPHVLRAGIELITLHKGDIRWYAGWGEIYIYTDHFRSGTDIFEEAIVHEAGHASLDPTYKYADDYLSALDDDLENAGGHISVYCQDYARECIAESFLAYIALTRCSRIGEERCDTIRETMPAQIKYFDSLGFNLSPMAEPVFEINAGLNDAWYYQPTSGQGFGITVLPVNKLVFVMWFTYDTELVAGVEGQRWYTMQGPYEGNTSVMEIHVTTGGVLDSENPKPVTKVDGSATLEFVNCTEGLLQYDIPSIGKTGSVPITRIAHDNVELCESLGYPSIQLAQ